MSIGPMITQKVLKFTVYTFICIILHLYLKYDAINPNACVGLQGRVGSQEGMIFSRAFTPQRGLEFTDYIPLKSCRIYIFNMCKKIQ